MQAYSNPKRESDPHSPPDVEVFYLAEWEIGENAELESVFSDLSEEGYYYWHCLPGCLPDSDPIGPFATEEGALQDAQEDSWQFEDEDTEE